MNPQPSHRGRVPLKITLIYAGVGILWILLTDELMSLIFKNPETFTRVEIIKGWLFIAVTALLLYVLIKRDISAIQESKKALKESEEKFEMLVETTASAIFIYRDRILHANHAMEVLTGYNKGELIKMTFYEIIHPDYREKIRGHCEALSRGTAEPVRCEYKIITKNKEERWVDLTSNIIQYEGEQSGLGTAFDITERKIAEEALRANEERFRLVVEGVTDYEIFMLDPTGRIVLWNIGAERSKGYRPEEVIGKHHSIFFKREDVALGLPDMELKMAADIGRFEDEGWRVRKDGSLFWADVVTTALMDKEGSLRGYSKVIRDISDRKRAEENLRESEERYRVIVDTASDAILTIDEESVIVFANPAVEKIFGFAPDEITGKPMTMLMPERLRNSHLTAMKRHIRTGKRNIKWEAVELPGLHKAGNELPLEISYGEFIKGERYFFTGIVRDISDRKQAEKEKEYKDMLERFNQELETLVAERTMSLMSLKLADRVRTPAAVIGWTGKRILERGDGLEKIKENVSKIIEEAEKLEITVKDFQSLLKIKEPVFSYGDVNEIVRDILPIIEREASRKEVRPVANLSEKPLRINAQKDLLRMAVFNILRNAVEATPEGGRITIETSAKGDNVILSISDTGSGIPKGMLEKIFDPLYSATIYKFGMGLPLVKQIISEHLGVISVESEEGKGTTFRIVFPVRWTEKSEAAKSEQEP